MYNVYSSQYNYQYGDQIHVPYSIASLVTYVKTNKKILQNFDFKKTFIFRENVENDIQKCKNVDILLCSCYVWNWEITLHLAKNVKKLNPNCLVIFGGPHVPLDVVGFFDNYPFVDILVHNEGELILNNILNEFLLKNNFEKIKGISTKNFTSLPEERIDDLNNLPSPYLTNTIWDLVEEVPGIKWICAWETNRGCPYHCTFCDWGSATFTKVRKGSDEKLFKEIEWFSQNKIVYIDCCDANFGMFFQRDLSLAKKLREVKFKTGYPEKFRQSWVKNTTDKIIPIAKELHAEGLLTAVGLAVESLDPTTLDVVKRANIKFSKFSELTDEFRENGLPTFTEIIRGLPGETLESFKNGLEILISDSKIDTIYIYNCGVLPNAPLNEPSYREKYGIKMVKSPIYLGHSSIHNREIEEYEYITTESKSFSLSDVKEMYFYSWMSLTLQSFGILEDIANYYHQEHGLKFMTFYEYFLNFCRSEKSVFSEEYDKVSNYINEGYSGNGWNHYDPNMGEIFWPIEEATWIRFTSQKEKLISGLLEFLKYLNHERNYSIDDELLLDLVNFQIHLLMLWEEKSKIKTHSFKYDWKSFFLNKIKLNKNDSTYSYQNKVIESDYYQWAVQTMWYGRRGKKYKCDVSELTGPIVNLSKNNLKTNTIQYPP
jgi:radical SAM superfamily enzyme YgiQ (UPF0313 family)